MSGQCTHKHPSALSNLIHPFSSHTLVSLHLHVLDHHSNALSLAQVSEKRHATHIRFLLMVAERRRSLAVIEMAEPPCRGSESNPRSFPWKSGIHYRWRMGVPQVVVVQRGASSPALSRRRILKPMTRSTLPRFQLQDRILQGAQCGANSRCSCA